MAAKIDQTKRQKKLEKRMKVDKVTNWFMINLAWGVLALILLRYMENTIMIHPEKMLIPAIFFGVIAVVLFVLGGMKDRQIIITSCERLRTSGKVIEVKEGSFL